MKISTVSRVSDLPEPLLSSRHEKEDFVNCITDTKQLLLDLNQFKSSILIKDSDDMLTDNLKMSITRTPSILDSTYIKGP